MTIRVFVDGQEGTTGLRIHERLAARSDIELLQIDPERRKDPGARRGLLNAADVAFLCLPDDAARESVSLVTNGSTRIIDASTAHRTDPSWAYGLPELSREQRDAVASSKRVAVPGCHATGFVIPLYPLVRLGVVPEDYPVTCQSLTGYSGGGKKLIAAYEGPGADRESLKYFRSYALGLSHKHLPEMHRYSGLAFPPLFTPVVGDFYVGMSISVPLQARLLSKRVSAADVREMLASYYRGERFVRVMPFESESLLDGGFFKMQECNDTNLLDIFVFGNDRQILLVSRLDNLGKGASGAAVQNMNIMLGLDEATGLE
ncbi:MAG: N-acetyl-gamma-glutamyl-phosphate reductase [Spirochaetes bacterium]|nr:N-acetyl-gamma-glutamyl-phosphate reductase [Spirochaetota bacterium]